MRSARGMVFAIIGVIVVLMWLIPSLLISDTLSLEELSRIRRIGPLALLAFCLMNVLFSSSEGGLTFGPAETSLLFPAPLTRRQLLAYKIIGNLGAALMSAAFITIFARRYSVMLIAAFVAVLLILTFMQLLGMLLALLANTLGAIAFNRRRRIFLGIVAILIIAALLQTGTSWLQRDWQQSIETILQNPIAAGLLAPMSWFINTLTAERIWPDLVQWGALAALVNLVLVGMIFALDAQFLESSVIASEKHYARLQRMRQGGNAALSVPAGKSRLAFPFLPRLGGVGPLVWRQLTTALRSLKTLLLIVIFFAIFSAPVFMQSETPLSAAAPALLISLLIGSTLIVPPLLPFDFRGDLDRIPFLKTLPLSNWRIVIGELLAPALILTAAQGMVLGIITWAAGLNREIWGLLALLLPVNFLIFSVENFFFLLFPMRNIAAHPGDFQLMGRNIVVWLAKMTAIGIALLPASIAGAAVFFLSGQNAAAAFSAAVLVVVMVCAAAVPLLAWAFQRFDVAHDTPPE